MITGELVAEAMGRAMAGERLPGPALAELQHRKLRELVNVAVSRSALYRRLYEGVELDRVRLTDLPVVTKKVVQEHFDEVVTDRRLTVAGVSQFCAKEGEKGSPWYLGEFAALMSSGTSGVRGYYVMDGPALADWIAVGYRQSNRSGAGAGAGGRGRPGSVPGGAPEPQRIAAVMLIEPFDAAGMLMRLIPESVGPKELIDIRDDFAAICGRLTEFQPTLLSSFPYMLRMLSGAAREGALRIRPTRITSSGDVLTESDRGGVRAAFGVEPYDYYCSTEVPYLAWECDVHEGLHVNADYVIVESVDAEDRPVAAGQLGDKLLVTNLSNRAMPLVRYEMSDQVEWMTGACGCGCALPRIRKVAGRVEHILTLPGAASGSVALIPEQIDEFVGGLAGLANYQIIQDMPAHLTVNFIAEAGADPGEVRRSIITGLERCFRRYGVAASVEHDLDRVERLQPIRPGSNKVCHYWNWCG